MLGARRRDRQLLRVVGHRDDRTGQYHLYITNVPPEKLAAEDIRSTYALRWEVELLFKELKQHYRLDQMPSRKPAVVAALLHAAILTLVVSRRLLDAVRQRLKRFADRLPTQRWATVFSAIALDLLLIATRPAREIKDLLKRVSLLLLHEAVDPNRKRSGLLAAVETRTHKYRTRIA